MTRDKFIRKWLANPQKQYNEQCRDEMRDDLDLVIQAAIGKSEQKQLITKIMNEDAKDGLYKKQTAVEWLVKTLELDTRFNGIMNDVIQQAKEMEKHQQDTFAIDFAEWYEEDVLAKGDYEMIAKDKKELLEIFKETYGKQ